MTNRYSFEGLSVAVLGLGVSGLSAAKVLRKLGAFPTVFDQKPSDLPDVVRATDQLYQDDVPVVSGWHGRIAADQFDLMVVSPGFRRDHPAIADFTSKPVLSEVELAYRISEAPMIAITGTNGKSTTTVLTWLIVNEMGVKGHLCGNIAGSGFPEKTLSAAAYEAKSDEWLVAEVSSYQLEFVSAIKPKVCTILNVTPDHMDRHHSFEDYFSTKMRLTENIGTGDTLVINSDEPSISTLRFRKSLKNGAKVVAFSSTGSGVTQNESTRRIGDVVYFGDDVFNLKEWAVVGDHNYSNLMCAWELAFAATGRSCDISKAVNPFNGLDHRMEIVGRKKGITVINNSMCTNPAALIASIGAIHQRQFILMGGNTKRLDFTSVQNYLTSREHEVIVFGPGAEKLNQQLGGHWQVSNSLGEAFAIAVREAQSGDCIILSPGCASADPYLNFRERGNAFKSIAMEWLNA